MDDSEKEWQQSNTIRMTMHGWRRILLLTVNFNHGRCQTMSLPTIYGWLTDKPEPTGRCKACLTMRTPWQQQWPHYIVYIIIIHSLCCTIPYYTIPYDNPLESQQTCRLYRELLLLLQQLLGQLLGQGEICVNMCKPRFEQNNIRSSTLSSGTTVKAPFL